MQAFNELVTVQEAVSSSSGSNVAFLIYSGLQFGLYLLGIYTMFLLIRFLKHGSKAFIKYNAS